MKQATISIGAVLVFLLGAGVASAAVPAWYKLDPSAATISSISSVRKLTDTTASTTCYIIVDSHGDGDGISCVK